MLRDESVEVHESDAFFVQVDLAVFEESPELHAVENVSVVRVGLKAELAVETVDMLEQVQVPENGLVSLEKDNSSSFQLAG